MTKMPRLLLALLVVTSASAVLFALTRQREDAFTLVTIPPASTPGFRDVAQESGIRFRMQFLPQEQGETFKINLYDHGCGVSVGDYDGDGDDDLYLLNQLGPNALYRNRGDGTFDDVTAEMGLGLDDRVSVGATFADYDNDGDQDLYVTSTRGGNLLLRNDRHAGFVDVTEEAGVTNVGHSQSAVFFDYDRDGLLDLYVAQTAKWTIDTIDERANYYPGKSGIIESPKEENRLYHNEGQGRFVDVTAAAGMAGRGWSSDMAVFDYDEDGWPDVLVACMFGRAQLYRNQQDGTFRDTTAEVLGKVPWGGTGVKVFDFNNDGQLDIYIVDMHSDMWMGADYSNSYYPAAVQSEKLRFDYSFGPNTEEVDQLLAYEDELEEILDFRHEEVVFGNAFYKALGQGQYVEISAEANLETFWPWGLATGDYDNDGLVDVFVTTGMGYPFYYWHNYLMMNRGAELFLDRSFALGIEPPQGGNYLPQTIRGSRSSRSSRCAATADFDGDGRLEIVVNNFNHEPYLFKNEFPRQNYVALRLTGTRSNRDAMGALVRIRVGNQTLTRQVESSGGYLACSSKMLHFGLGQHAQMDAVEILWPSGTQQLVTAMAVNAVHEITEPASDEPAS